MRKILFITTRNIVRTCGELRLIKNRAEALYSEYGIKSDFLILTSTNNRKMEEEFSYDAKIRIINYKPSNIVNLFSTIHNITSIAEKDFVISEYTDIIISGLFIPLVLKTIKEKWPHKKIFMDIHGAYEDIYNSVPKNDLVKRTIYYLVFRVSKWLEPKQYKYCDGFFVVSTYLKEYIEKLRNAREMSKKQFVIAPCALSGRAIDDDEYIKNRESCRCKYGFSDNEIVMVYSGGNSPWQRFDKSLAFYQECREKNNCFRFLILSQDIEQIKKQYGNIEGAICDSIQPSEVYNTLCGGDFGLIIRDYSETNACAYPNKFLEYVNGRLLVVANDSVVEIARHINKYHVGIILEDGMDVYNDVINIEELRKNYLGKQLLQDTSFENTVKDY